MERYLVSVLHSTQECIRGLKAVESAGMITHFDWGCKDGVHAGWVIIEAESSSQALMVVPPLLRNNATAVKLTKFSPEDVRAMHG